MPDTERARCVYVSLEKGEKTRRILSEMDAIIQDLEIKSTKNELHIPVHKDIEIPKEFNTHSDSFNVIETPTKPREILGYEPSFEQIADIALIEEEHPKEVADALIRADNAIESVYNIESKVKGDERTRELKHIAGGKGTEVIHREYGASIKVDLEDVYFSARLATERNRVASQIEKGEKVLDMFAGAGPFTIHAALKCANVTATDINPVAIQYIEKNAEINNVEEKVTALNIDAREISDSGFDRIIMNLPHTANEYLDKAIDVAGDGAIIHLYDIQSEPEIFSETEREIRKVASDKGVDIEIISEVNVRSYAPHEYNICIDFRLDK